MLDSSFPPSPSSLDVRRLSALLATPPLSISVSPFDLDKDWDESQLLQLLSDIAARIDDVGVAQALGGTGGLEAGTGVVGGRGKAGEPKQVPPLPPPLSHPLSPLAPTVTHEPRDLAAFRIAEFLRVLRFEGAVGDLDPETHATRAYLARFLADMEVPGEFEGEEAVTAPLSNLRTLQSLFPPLHKRLLDARKRAAETQRVKDEVGRMERERVGMEQKVAKGGGRGGPDRDRWLAAAKALRIEREREVQGVERVQDQRAQLSRIEARVGEVMQKLREAKSAADSATPDAVLARAREDARVNRVLLEDTLEKVGSTIAAHTRLLADLDPLVQEKDVPESQLREWEVECAQVQREIAAINEQRVAADPARDATLATLRQQHHLVLLKRTSAADRLQSLLDTLSHLRSDVERLEAQAGGVEKVPRGEEFKKYVADLREKSAVYKKRKAEVAEATAEGGVLQRTVEILQAQEKAQMERIAAFEKTKGVEGYSIAQETLEKISEQKSDLDQSKTVALQDIAAMVDQLVATISERKQKLQPVIAELRTARQKLAEAEAEYAERKRMNDAVELGLDSEAQTLSQEVRAHRAEIEKCSVRIAELRTLLAEDDSAAERAAEEMRAIVGGDDTAEGRARRGGFKTYRDLYAKKIAEAESVARQLKESQREVKERHDTNLTQRALFADLKKLLEVKREVHGKALSGNRAAVAVRTANEREQNRLVL
ncbi:Intraflagellar transport protein 81 [Gonapodya sp. JEL0774]|nr:Intraflagellar transport protein 81 [Gonapodya sp. JEL0774]